MKVCWRLGQFNNPMFTAIVEHFHIQRANLWQGRASCTKKQLNIRTTLFYELFSISWIGAKMFCLLVSTMQPFITISSSMKCTFSRWNMMSSSHTLPKWRSIVSTKRCMNSRIANSFCQT
uniref:Pco080381 n=1 Tax=Arundo donax TaxID=35708 RepID=A0A0A9DBL1_ARUDO